jgi:hypothetical protein
LTWPKSAPDQSRFAKPFTFSGWVILKPLLSTLGG